MSFYLDSGLEVFESIKKNKRNRIEILNIESNIEVKKTFSWRLTVRIARILSRLIMVLFFLVLALYFVIQIPAVQTYIAGKVADYLSEKAGAKISIGYVSISFFNSILLEDVFVEDKLGDTLAFVPEINAGITKIDIWDQELEFGNIVLLDANLNIKQDSSKIMNFQFLIDAFSSEKDSTKTDGWKIDFQMISFKNTSLSYNTALLPDSLPEKMDFNSILLSDLNFSVSELEIDGDTTSLLLENLSFKEKSGMTVYGLTCGIGIDNKNLAFSNLKIFTPNSRVFASNVTFSVKEMKDYNDFINKVKIKSEFEHSYVGLKDIGFFAPVLNKYDERIELSGQVLGKISDIRTKKLLLKFGDNTVFDGKISLSGLPNVSATFFIADINELTTSKKDLDRFYYASSGEYLLPQLATLGKINYKGNITGLLNDFVAYGSLSTDAGNISSDLSLKMDTASGKISFNGKVRTPGLNVGAVTGDKDIGNIALNISISGYSSKNSTYGELKGMVDFAEYKNYSYSNLEINGKLDNKMFEGKFEISDPNIAMNFTGKMDFNKKIPAFDFVAYVKNANLFELNLDLSDSLIQTSALVSANFSGNNIDNIVGELLVTNGNYSNSKNQMLIDSVRIISEKNDTLRIVSVESDIINGSVAGDFTFASLVGSVNMFIREYLPSYLGIVAVEMKEEINNFNFDFKLNNPNRVLHLFYPDSYVESGSEISGSFNSLTDDISLKTKSQKLKFGDYELSNLGVSIRTFDSLLVFNSDCQQLEYLDFHLDDINFKSLVNNDAMNFNLQWKNIDSINYSGYIECSAKVFSNPETLTPVFDLVFAPSSFTVADTVWHISDCKLLIDSSSINIDNLAINNSYQFLYFNGAVSENIYDTLKIEFNDLVLQNFNQLTNTFGIDLRGELNGQVRLSKLYSSPLFEANFDVDSLFVNNEIIGHTLVSSNWDNNDKLLYCDIHTENNGKKELWVKGDYVPEGGKLDFKINIDDFNLAILNPYFKGNMSDISGFTDGVLWLRGTTKNPILKGHVDLIDTRFGVDYLQTKYLLKNSRIDISPDSILIRRMIAEDLNKEGKTADINGWIAHKNFADFKYNITVDANDFMFLNTSEIDNSLYYGKAFATGVIAVSGNPKNTKIDISVRSEKNTRLFIPLSSSGDVSTYDFVTFVDKSGDNLNKDDDYRVDLSGIELNFDLEVTPDAEIQIIFDSKAGDIIKGRGAGNLNMEITTNGSFNMYGDYVIEEGEYLFTLENVINKKFKVEKGGVISWNGDPYSGYMDINAIYRTKAKPYDLFVNLIDSADAANYMQRVPVDCRLSMTGSLLSPQIKFGIDLPSSGEDVREKLSMILTSEEIINKQILSLLVLNRFMAGSQDGVATSTTGSNSAIGANSSELLSNQLSHWLSQISNDFDIGVNYRPGDQISSDEVEVALSTQLFNDRVSINSNVGVGGNQQSASGFDGDFELEWKITRSDKVKAKAYTRTNDNLIYDSPTTQGVSLFYKEDFNTWGELLKRYWFKSKKDVKIETKTETKTETETETDSGIIEKIEKEE